MTRTLILVVVVVAFLALITATGGGQAVPEVQNMPYIPA